MIRKIWKPRFLALGTILALLVASECRHRMAQPRPSLLVMARLLPMAAAGGEDIAGTATPGWTPGS